MMNHISKQASDVSVKAFSLAGMVEYSEDSIVSRTLADKEAGTITLFAFDKGQRLSEHTAPYDAVVQVLDGRGLFTVGGQEIPVSNGQFLIMPAHVPHSVHAADQFKMLLTMIRSKDKK